MEEREKGEGKREKKIFVFSVKLRVRCAANQRFDVRGLGVLLKLFHAKIAKNAKGIPEIPHTKTN